MTVERSPSARKAKRALDRGTAIEQVILDAAVEAMSENGYHGTSVRQIADCAGMSVANVYHYFPSKHEILFRLMDDNAQHLMNLLEEIVYLSPPHPQERLDAAVALFVNQHIGRQKLTFVTSSELRALDVGARAKVVAKRRAIEEIFRRIVQHGCDTQVFRVSDVRLTTRVILDMAPSVAVWYRPQGPRSPDEMAQYYVRLVHRIVGIDEE